MTALLEKLPAFFWRLAALCIAAVVAQVAIIEIASFPTCATLSSAIVTARHAGREVALLLPAVASDPHRHKGAPPAR